MSTLNCETNSDAGSQDKLRTAWSFLHHSFQRFGSLPDKCRAAYQVAQDVFFNTCTPSVLNRLAPWDDTVVHEGITYGPCPRHKLDVYMPAKNGSGPAPIVVFFHGGSWMSGERGIYRYLGAALAARGIAVVIPDYRLYPDVTFPAFVHDAADVVAWTRTHACAFGGDPSHIFLMGHSAGAHMATLLALDPSFLQQRNLAPDMLAGVIGVAGPYDFLPLKDPLYMGIFGPEEGWPKSQPINFVTEGAPPMLLATAQSDDLVRPGNTYRLAAKLRSMGNEARVKVYARAGHITIIGAFAAQLTAFGAVRDDVLKFINDHTLQHAPQRMLKSRRKIAKSRALRPRVAHAPA
jgi:acetyl esterase/lipase